MGPPLPALARMSAARTGGSRRGWKTRFRSRRRGASTRQPTRSASSFSIPTWRRAPARPPTASDVARENSAPEPAPRPESAPRVASPPELANAPLPPRRPTDLAVAPSRPAPAGSVVDAAPRAAEPDNRSIFEKIFGSPKPETTVVAYANPETPPPRVSALNSANGAPGHYDKYTAVYDISAHIVYLPSGAKLEAHSGLGGLIDDPHHVDVRAKGATPPDVYELSLREKPFYGIQALRLKPIGNGDQFGRTGLLAHPYMLGPNGDSFGCVSFKDYDAFLQAYQSGEVKKLAVVARLQ